LDPRSNGGTTQAAAIAGRLERFVRNIRETNVILDADLAALYDVGRGIESSG